MHDDCETAHSYMFIHMVFVVRKHTFWTKYHFSQHYMRLYADAELKNDMYFTIWSFPERLIPFDDEKNEFRCVV